MERNPCDLSKKLRILKNFLSSIGMTVNTDKMKVMIIKSIKVTYNNFLYDNNILEEVPSYKYFGTGIHKNLNWNYIIEKMINGRWKSYYGLENNCKLVDLYLWDKKKFLFETFLIPVILY
jgi:hypothetical protein